MGQSFPRAERTVTDREDHESRIRRISNHLCRHGSLEKTKDYIQHGHTSVFDHVHNVSRIALHLNERLHLKADPDRLVRAALLHDYFLYDWHDKGHEHLRPHGWHHPKVAAHNAHRDYGLDEREMDAIHGHMFPFTLHWPRHREGWILTMADKISTYKELKDYWRHK